MEFEEERDLEQARRDDRPDPFIVERSAPSVMQVNGLAVSGIRRLRYSSRIFVDIFALLFWLAVKLFFCILLVTLAAITYNCEVEQAVQQRRQEIVFQMTTFYSVFSFIIVVNGLLKQYQRSTWRLLNGTFNLSIIIVGLTVFCQGKMLEQWLSLYEDLTAEEIVVKADPSKDSQFIWIMYLVVYFHESLILSLLFPLFFCVFLVIGLNCYDFFRIRRRRRQNDAAGRWEDYDPEAFGPDLPQLQRQESIKKRVTYLERLKQAAFTQLAVEDGSECCICMEQFTENQDVVGLNCLKHVHIYHHDCIKGWIQAGHRQCPICRTEISLQ